MRTPMNQTPTIIPPAIFSATLKARLDRTDRERRENAPNNDGRTGFVVRY